MLSNLRKVDKDDLKANYGKNKYKLHYIYHEFTLDFFSMDLSTLPQNASPSNSAGITPMSCPYALHSMSTSAFLCVKLHRLSKTCTTSVSPTSCKTAAICVKPFVDLYPYEKGNVFTDDETYIKIRGVKTYVWLIMNAATRLLQLSPSPQAQQIQSPQRSEYTKRRRQHTGKMAASHFPWPADHPEPTKKRRAGIGAGVLSIGT